MCLVFSTMTYAKLEDDVDLRLEDKITSLPPPGKGHGPFRGKSNWPTIFMAISVGGGKGDYVQLYFFLHGNLLVPVGSQSSSSG